MHKSKQIIIEATHELQHFLREELPQTGVYTAESADRLASYFDVVEECVMKGDYRRMEETNPFGIWRELTDFFGMPQNGPPVIQQYGNLSSRLQKLIKEDRART